MDRQLLYVPEFLLRASKKSVVFFEHFPFFFRKIRESRIICASGPIFDFQKSTESFFGSLMSWLVLHKSTESQVDKKCNFLMKEFENSLKIAKIRNDLSLAQYLGFATHIQGKDFWHG